MTLNSHNTLAYCQVTSKTYGDCPCPTPGPIEHRTPERHPLVPERPYPRGRSEW